MSDKTPKNNQQPTNPLTRKEFLKKTGILTLGGLIHPLSACTDNPVNGGDDDDDDDKKPPKTPKTNLDLQLINAETGEHSPGYIILNGNKEYRSDGRFDLTLERNITYSIQSGLSEGNDPQSYLRTLRINPAQADETVRIEQPHTDFLIRDPTGKQLGELTRDGYNLDKPMDITRFLGHMRESHYNITGNGVQQRTTIQNDGQLLRWTNTDNGFGPEKIIFADTANMLDGNDYDMDEADLLFNRFNEQLEHLIQPMYPYKIPFERVEHFNYTGNESVENNILIRGSPNINPLASVSQIYDLPTMYGAVITIRTPIPDKETHPNNYQRLLNFIFPHEMAVGCNVAGGRPKTHTGLEESILQQGWMIPPLPDKLPLIDYKAAGIIHNQLYDAGLHMDDTLGLPEGFTDPKHDLQEKTKQPAHTYDPASGLYTQPY